MKRLRTSFLVIVLVLPAAFGAACDFQPLDHSRALSTAWSEPSGDTTTLTASQSSLTRLVSGSPDVTAGQPATSVPAIILESVDPRCFDNRGDTRSVAVIACPAGPLRLVDSTDDFAPIRADELLTKVP